MVLFSDLPTNKLNIIQGQGRRAYESFDTNIELTKLMRQQGETPAQIKFSQCLQNLRDNVVTREDWRLLSSRVQSNLTPTEIAEFDDALHLFGRKKDVRAHNFTKLREAYQPVLISKADNNWSGAKNADIDGDDVDLENELLLQIGARTMLTRNLWTERGLVNGSHGTIKGFVWPAGTDDPRNTRPLAVLVKFDDYNGPTLDEPIDGDFVVPIFPQKSTFKYKGAECFRVHFFLAHAWAITIHKAQGLTVPKSVQNLGIRKDFAGGLTYVGISRVRNLEDIMFQESFDFERFAASATAKIPTQRAKDWARRYPASA